MLLCLQLEISELISLQRLKKLGNTSKGIGDM